MRTVKLLSSLEDAHPTAFLDYENLEEVQLEGNSWFSIDVDGRESEDFVGVRSIPVNRRKMKIRLFRKDGNELFSFSAPYDIV